MTFPDPLEPNPLRRVSRFSLVLLAAGAAVAGCERSGPGEPAAAVAACVPGGELEVSVYGSVQGELHWRGGDLECEGMRRPHGQGARLRFEGPTAWEGGAARLAFIIALPDLVAGRTAAELPAGVTLIAVDEGRFFSTAEQTGCWADVGRHERLDGNDWLISGLLYCVSPLAEVNGGSSVSLRDLRFTGRLDWSEPE